MARPRPTRGMGVVADPYRGPVKKRGGKRPARPGWGQALLGRSRRGWSHGGSLHGYPGGIAGMKKTVAEIEGMSPAWTGTPAGKMVRGIAKTIRKQAPGKTRKKPPGGWSLGGALNSKRKGYQQGRALTPRAVKSAWGLNRPGDAAAMVRSMSIPGRERSFARMQAGEIPHFGTSSGGSVKTPPGGWNRGGPAKFRDDQSLGIRGGKVRKPVGYQGGGTSGYSDAYLQGQGVDPSMYRKANRKLMKQKRQNILSGKSVRTPAPKRKRVSTKKGGGG